LNAVEDRKSGEGGRKGTATPGERDGQDSQKTRKRGKQKKGARVQTLKKRLKGTHRHKEVRVGGVGEEPTQWRGRGELTVPQEVGTTSNRVGSSRKEPREKREGQKRRGQGSLLFGSMNLGEGH